MNILNRKAIAKRICPCIPSEHGDNELEISGEDILVDGLIKKGKGENQLEVAIGDGMEFTIHGDLKNKGKKKLMNNSKVSARVLITYNKAGVVHILRHFEVEPLAM